MKNIQSFIPMLLGMILTSCSQNSETIENGGGTAGTWNIPGIGTEYIFQTMPTDSTMPEFDTLTILNTGQHIGGKTSVILYAAGSSEDTEYNNIESNGDFSFSDITRFGSSAPIFEWITFPTGSRQTTAGTGVAVDTFESGEHIVHSNVFSFIGFENLTLPAGVLSTLHVRNTVTNINFGGSTSEINAVDYWFDLSIGLYVKVTVSDTTDGQLSEKYESELIKYLPR